MTMKRRNFIAAIVAGLSLAVSAHGASAQEVIKIGVLAPISGGAAADGQEMVNGAELAIKEINAQGGIGGYTFELVVGDVEDRSASSVATSVERLLSNRDMGAVLTGYASTTNFEIETMAEQEMIYMVGAQSPQTAAIISPSPDDFGTIWSLTPSFDGYNTGVLPVIEGLAEAGTLDLPNKKLAIVSSDNPYSKGIADGIVESFSAAGWEITQNELLPFGEINDWRGFLAKVRQDPPALLINTDYVSSNAATFMSQFKENPTDSLVFIQYAPSVPEFLELTKENSNGVVYNLLGGILNTPKNPRAAEVMAKFQDEYGLETGTYGAMLYEMVYIYADALQEVGDPADRAAIGEAIGASTHQTALGVVAFDPATHLALQDDAHVPLQFYQIQEGERVLFSPDQYLTGAFVEPDWMK
ncbi:ABC transporter substrate-binding protein [Pacificibacter sp. AS14]|uniref:ABC transporter substrate-binding protein n=1 Tax=Pacificibacter sp. AS14 TaxID=3135785 RepID=UPI00316B5CD4